MGSSDDSRRILTCCLLFAIAIGFVMAVLNIPSHISCVSSIDSGPPVVSQDSYLFQTATEVEKAGWPLTFQIRYLPQTIATGRMERPMETLCFSWWRLFLNVACIVVAMTAVTFYTLIRHRRIAASRNGQRTRLLFDSATAGICFAVPAILYGLSLRTAIHHLDVAADLTKYGRCRLTTELPDWMATRIPKTFEKGFMRITDVLLVSPSHEAIRRVASIKTLNSLSIERSEIEPADLKPIIHAKQLINLSLVSCLIDDESFDCVADLTQLRWLSLTGTPMSNLAIKKLDRMKHLEGLDLTRTGIRLSDLGTPRWSRTIQDLRLTRPDLGNSDRLVIKDWPWLTHLSVQGYEQRVNDGILALEISDCPQLTSLHLDRWQRHALTASNLPMLKSIQEPVDFILENHTIESLPCNTRWQKLHLSNLVNLSEINCQAADLESMRLTNMPHLHAVSLKSGTFDDHEFNLRGPQYHGSGVKRFIDAVRDINSITSVDIDNVRLDENDVKQLCKVPFLRDLKCVNTSLCEQDLSALGTKESLHVLDLGNCQLNERRLNELLQLPYLKRIKADLSKIKNLSIVENAQIDSLQTLPMRRLDSLNFEKLPRYFENIVIQENVNRLRIRSLPALSGLIVECPWPEDYSIEGIPGLERFAGGGPHIDDSLLELLSGCTELDQVTLAYPKISRSKMPLIGKMTSLTSLEVPGCMVDDEVVSQWGDLSRLRRICLDDTAIDSETLRWLQTQESLRSVSLNYVKLSPQAQTELANLKQITDLSLVQTEISDHAFARLLEGRAIENLNLSRTSINQSKLNSIARSRSLTYCVMNGCEVDYRAVQELLESNPKIEIEINRTHGFRDQAWAASIEHRVHHSNAFRRFHHRINHQHRAMVRSAESNDETSPTSQCDVLVSRPFSLALFRNSSEI